MNKQAHRLPFPPDQPLFETIRRDYLLDVLKWLADFHDPTSHAFLGTKLGSTWGVAYSLICLLQAKAIYLESEIFPAGFEDRVDASVEFLLSRASQGKETCHWDRNIWDTAVIARALMVYAKEQPGRVDIGDVAVMALRWLGLQVMNWHNLRYTLGLAELSQMLQTLVVARETMPKDLERISVELDQSGDQADILEELVNEIVHSARVARIVADGTEEEVVVWDEGVFGTSESIISLAQYVDSKALQVPAHKKSEILDLIARGLRFIELQQRDGRWGIEEETAVALRAYLVGHRTGGKSRDPEPHIVFKALRYLCDEKTVFPDGSIAHEMEPTIYYALAMIEVLKGWRLAEGLCEEKPTIELYDFILWNTPARSTHERVLRTRAESDASSLREKNSHLARRLEVLSKRLVLWQNLLYGIVWFSLMVLLILFSKTMTASTIALPVGVTVNNWEAFLALVVAWAGLGGAGHRILAARRKLADLQSTEGTV